MLEKLTPKSPADVSLKTPVINVWGFKSPLFEGEPFKAAVRVKAVDGMSLEGSTIKIVDSTTGHVLGSSRVGTAEDTRAGKLQDEIELTAPAEPGMHKYFAVLDDGSDSIPVQVSFPFSVVPKGEREITVTCKDDKSGKPLAARLFLYNTKLDKTKPIDVRADENGVAHAKIVPNVDYKVKAVCEDYVMSFLDIPAEAPENDRYELPMRYVFNVKIKRPF
ncbi:MAG: hypothetical protein IKE43_10985 [Coriobacteriales bacterium]|nr:hypothetical protein [Coriobacteriales bacterium]